MYTALQKKNSHFVFCSQLWQMNSDFRNSFTVRFCRKFSIHLLYGLPPHLSCVATLPCKIWKSNIFVFQKQSLPLLIIFSFRPLWPSNSPDLNPVDYAVWGILQERVYKHHRITDVKRQLTSVIRERQAKCIGYVLRHDSSLWDIVVLR